MKRRNRRRIVPPALALVAALLTTGLSAAPAAASCSHFGARFAEMAVGEPTPHSFPVPRTHFYWVTESSTLSFTVIFYGHNCSGITTNVDWTTENATAVAPSDYTASGGKITAAPWDIFPEYEFRSVPIASDGVAESVVEHFRLKLLSTSEANRLNPFDVPAYIVDDDAAGNQVAIPSETYTVNESEAVNNPVFSIPVFRGGPATGITTVPFTVTGTATEGSDYEVVNASKQVQFNTGERMKLIQIKVINDTEHESADETVNIALGTPVGATLGAPATATTLTIQDNDLPGGGGPTPPVSWFHHPKHDKIYKKSSFKLAEMHVYALDDIPFGTQAAQMGLQRKMKSGACKWWNGNKWVNGKCGTVKKWLDTTHFGGFNDKDFYLYKAPALKPSIKTNVRNYTVYSRAQDKEGTWETGFTVGGTRGNKNTFNVKKG